MVPYNLTVIANRRSTSFIYIIYTYIISFDVLQNKSYVICCGITTWLEII